MRFGIVNKNRPKMASSFSFITLNLYKFLRYLCENDAPEQRINDFKIYIVNQLSTKFTIVLLFKSIFMCLAHFICRLPMAKCCVQISNIVKWEHQTFFLLNFKSNWNSLSFTINFINVFIINSSLKVIIIFFSHLLIECKWLVCVCECHFNYVVSWIETDGFYGRLHYIRS